ncbi:MAG: DUF87 domain-containing protein [Chloroflexi bacterium]|nr:DUF87 domain-containing protein [Chloroflexota bacterium]
MARKSAAVRPVKRTPTTHDPARVRSEIIAIAISLLAVLTLVTFVTDQGAVLRWWRTSLFALFGAGAVLVPFVLGYVAAAAWYAPLRVHFISPGIGIAIVCVAVLGVLHVAGRFGGLVGELIGGGATGALGGPGALVLLVAIAAVGLVLAAKRGVSGIARTAFERRPRVALRPGDILPGRSGTAFARAVDEIDDAPVLTTRTPSRDEPDVPPQQLRINMPEPKSPKPAPKAPPAAPTIASTVAAVSGAAAIGGPLAGLPSAMTAAEGVMHAAADHDWKLPSVETMSEGDAGHAGGASEVQRRAQVIEETLAHFNIAAKVVEATVGPVVTRYEIKPAPGVKLSRIEALNDDLALALAARTLRIEAPVPGKSVVGIEVPNIAVGLVTLRDVVETAIFRDANARINLALGRDVSGSPIVLDLAAMPHLLVAGQTGSGKSVLISSILASILLSKTPDEVRLLIGDLKRVDFSGFRDIPHLIVDVMTESDKILNALYWVTGEMDRRYRLFARASARNIAGYNETRTGPDRIPYIVFVIDELADLMLQAPIQVEKQITRIAQLARATGIHLVLGTQRPSVDVITGLIKANIPARIAFATASAVDSRTILDMIGAEKLLGRGDMLVLRPDLASPIRAQGVFVSDKEIGELSKHWVDQAGRSYDRHAKVTEGEDRLVRTRDDGGDGDIDDSRYDEAVDIVQRAGQASVSMLQRKMTVGFARAGRLIDLMEQNGVIGPSVGPGKMREVYGSAAPRINSEDS